jgi:hypothetical protein
MSQAGGKLRLRQQPQERRVEWGSKARFLPMTKLGRSLTARLFFYSTTLVFRFNIREYD